MKKIVVDGTTYVPESSQVINPEGLTYCIVRTYSSGVFAGYIDFNSFELGRYVYDSRRLWKWDSQFTLSELSQLGIRNSNECKFAITIPIVGLTQIIEVIPCTEVAKKSIEGEKNYIP